MPVIQSILVPPPKVIEIDQSEISKSQNSGINHSKEKYPKVEKLSEVGQPILENTQENKTESDSIPNDRKKQDINNIRNT